MICPRSHRLKIRSAGSLDSRAPLLVSQGGYTAREERKPLGNVRASRAWPGLALGWNWSARPVQRVIRSLVKEDFWGTRMQ